MPKGTVKWFNPAKQFGFIGRDGSDKDVFVHMSAVQASGLASLEEGQLVAYEIETDQSGKDAAVNLSLVET